MGDKFLTIDEAARLINRPLYTLRYWRQHKKGPRSARIGARVMYRESDLLAWMDAQFERESA